MSRRIRGFTHVRTSMSIRVRISMSLGIGLSLSLRRSPSLSLGISTRMSLSINFDTALRMAQTKIKANTTQKKHGFGAGGEGTQFGRSWSTPGNNFGENGEMRPRYCRNILKLIEFCPDLVEVESAQIWSKPVHSRWNPVQIQPKSTNTGHMLAQNCRLPNIARCSKGPAMGVCVVVGFSMRFAGNSS